MSATPPEDRIMLGLALSFCAYALFSMQDAIVKHLVTFLSVPQVLFTRSVLILGLLTLVQGPGIWRTLADPRDWRALIGRAALIMAAWLSYFTAARHLGLAELTTLYFAAPIVVVVLAMTVLRERVSLMRWAVVSLGFGGVLLAANPAQAPSLQPMTLALIAACCWAGTQVLARYITRNETTTTQMLVSNGLFFIVCGLTLPFVWITPTLFQAGLMLGLGLAGTVGQYLMFEAFRHAPASVLAPVEYSGLVWAFIHGFVFFAEIPAPHVFAGAALIVASCLMLVWYESRRIRA